MLHEKRRLENYSSLLLVIYYLNNAYVKNNEAQSEEIKDITVIWVLIDGPAVSLNGSPTVSPITPALCAAEPFPL